jgi:hypothetical protein
MTIDETRAWLVWNMPHIALYYFLPALTVLTVLARTVRFVHGRREYRRGQRDGMRSNYRNAGLDPADYGY